MKISILDCSLRDGGYVNDFHFGAERIRVIKEKLSTANIEIIECGFLQSSKNNTEYSLYGSVEQIQLPQKHSNQMYVAMVVYGEIDADEIAPYQPNYIEGIRLTFHNSEWEGTKYLAQALIAKGYKVFIQPVGTTAYTDEELIALINEVNALNPYAFYLVDTFGSMYKNDLLRMFFLTHHNLEKNICLGYHSHNNMQLSFANAMTLLELHMDRHIIIDASVFGMGRGAGNLNTELITHFININIEERYNLVPLLELIDDIILPIYKYTPWGFSEPYYLSAIMEVHPNYAAYLIDKQSVSMVKILELLRSIPKQGRHLFKKEDIETLYHIEMSNCIDDSLAIRELTAVVNGREVLVIAPGNSVRQNTAVINKYIKLSVPFIISLNFIPEDVVPDFVFVSNRKRFRQIINNGITTVVTSNVIIDNMTDGYVIDYASLLLNEADSSGILVLRFLSRLGVKHVALAGYDGFTGCCDYYDEGMDNYLSTETVAELNCSMSKQLLDISNDMQLTFITPSAYEVEMDD